ncbi:HAD hydrolase-like protein [Pseudoroseicyclus tamaricis]|uniref:HAD hydrolase-like protein n=1 Tax=Pseudoroseicyclus tamaricis TaxID=2705421 RepID=A0A6B2K259_9RHOB|nr:HAD hydrolase-like protein [Pseudoroseicyclus tamaricis]NDV01882.1 HAD hydrolase-like protein [Pseudoroseicyclus tamaricis]
MAPADLSPGFLFFDLDGTLVDPAPGIIGSVQEALTALGQPAPPHQDLLWVIGPPLRASFAKLLGEEGDVERAVALYRATYSEGGLFRAEPYEGIFEALTALKGNGYRLFVCTSKPLPFARRVIAHFGFMEYFEEIYGPDLDGRFDDKGDLIAHILHSQNLPAEEGCMIGDRANDTLAARRNALRSIGVTWGYGSHRELRENGATILCETAHQLPDKVRSLLGN